MRLLACRGGRLVPHARRSPKTMKAASKVLSTVGALILLFLGWMLISLEGTTRKATGLSSVDWLPSSAQDINFYERTGFGWLKYYDCHIPKADFQLLAASNHWIMTQATNVSITVRDMLNLKPITSIDGIEINIVTNAEVYNNRRPNGGGITVVFDPHSERMYVTQNHR